MSRIFRFMNREKVSIYQVMTACFIVYMALVNGGRGVLWIIYGDHVLESATVYDRMDEVFPIQTWGLLFFISGFLLMVSAFTHSGTAYITLMIGGLFGLFCNAFLYMAGVIDGLNVYTPYLSALNLIVNLAFFIIGGVMLWKEKKTTNM